MSGFISDTITSILSNGISLHLESQEEEQFYIMKLQEYFVSETDFPAYIRKGDVLEIEGSDMQLGMEVIVRDSTLYMLPYSQDVFEIFTEILKFIANKHTEVVSEFRGSEETRIESISEVNKTQNEDTEKEEESSSDDDYEWV